MIIQCKSCSRKFVVNDVDIPKKGGTVKCGYCSVTWHQMPYQATFKKNVQPKITGSTKEINEGLSVDKIVASDGKSYRFLGTQWAQLLPSGKTGLFAKKKIGKELDKLTGRKITNIGRKRQKKNKEIEINPDQKIIDPSLISEDNNKRLPDIYTPKSGIGFFGYFFLIIIIGFSIVGILRTFENDLLNNFPETEFIYILLDEQLEYLAETVKNMIIIVNDLMSMKY